MRRTLTGIAQRLATRRASTQVAGATFALIIALHQFEVLSSPVAAVLAIVASLAGAAGFAFGTDTAGDGEEARDRLARIELAAKEWEQHDSSAQPDGVLFPEGKGLLARLPPDDAMSYSAKRFVLLLAIQYGDRWWARFASIRGDSGTAPLLMTPLRTSNLGWNRVPLRAAYLLQYLPTHIAERAIASSAADPATAFDDPLVNAALNHCVRELLAAGSGPQADRMREIRTSLMREFDAADSLLGRASDLP